MEDGRVAFLDFGMTKKLDREQIVLEQRAFDAASRDDPEAFRQALHDLGFIKKPSKLDAERLMEHMGAVGGWYIEDREIEITPKRVMKIIESTNDPRSEYFDLMRRESIPADELMGRRMEIGVVAVLGQLGAKRNWHRIMREWVYADPPATELGEQEWEYFEGRGVKRTPGLAETLSRRSDQRGGAMKQDQTRLGAEQEELGAAERAPGADPLPALRRRGDDPAGVRLPRPRPLLARRRRARRRDPAAGDRRLRAQRRRHLLRVGLAAAADMIFRGEEATVGDGLAVARSRFSQICGWAALSTAIGVFMGVLENQGGIAGTIAARFVGMAWSLVTFIAVPVIAIEGTGAFGTLKRSGALFRERWGQQITGNIAIGGAVFLLGMLPSGDPGRGRHRDLGLGQLRRRPAASSSA